MALEGIRWSSIVNDGICGYLRVFVGILFYSFVVVYTPGYCMAFYGIGTRWYWMVLNGVGWCWMVLD